MIFIADALNFLIYEKDFNNLCYALFSEQSTLNYIERIKDDYDCFYNLVLDNEIYKSDINPQDEYLLNLLISYNLISIENNLIAINDSTAICVLYDLYKNEVISYWNTDLDARIKIDSLVNNGLLKTSSSLLSSLESNFLDYMLTSKFDNSLSLRNMYLHGTQPNGDDILHRNNYMIILRSFILVIIKINDELCLKDSIC